MMRSHPARRRCVAAAILLVMGAGLPSALAWGQDSNATTRSEAASSPGETLRQALELYRTQQFSEAADLFARYLEFHPDEWAARKFLGLCFLRLQRPEQALREFNAISAMFPQDRSLQQAIREARGLLKEQHELEAKRPKPEEIQQWVTDAERLIQARKTVEAEALLLRVLEEVPSHELALYRQAEIHMGTGRFLEAASLYGRVFRLRGALQRDAEVRRARCLAWAERYPDAASHFESYLRIVPDDSAARFDLAEVYRWMGRPADAVSAYLYVLETAPAHIPARLGLALSYEALGRYEEALREFEAVLQTDSENQEARDGRARSIEAMLREKKRLAWVAQEQKNYQEALRLLAEYVRARPDDIEVARQLARLYSWAGDLIQAREQYEKYLALAPTDQSARVELAEVQSWQGDSARARESFSIILRDEPDNLRALVGIIRSYLWSGVLDGVEPYLEHLEHIEPANALVPTVRKALRQIQKDGMRAHAEKLQLAGDSQAAVVAYREYLATYGPDQEVELHIARLYAWAREYEKAIEEYQSYLARYPNADSARLELADVQRWKADYENALQSYTSFLAHNPRHPRGLLGRAETFFATRADLFEVREAYEQAARADPNNRLIVERLRDIASRLRPRAQFQTQGIFDSDGLQRVVFQPRVTFLLPRGYRLTSLFYSNYTHQDRFLSGSDPALGLLNQYIAELGGTIWGARTGLRLERQRSWGSWGAEGQVGSFSHGRISYAVAADLAKQLGERGLIWARYEREEAAFELNTLASLAGGILGDTWRVRYHQKLPHDFYVSPGYAITYLSDSRSFGFADNLRHVGDLRLSYRRFRRFQPGYSYSVIRYRRPSPLYFSPGLYQAHRFEFLMESPRGKRSQFALNSSLGLGRIDGRNTLEFTLAPQVSFRLLRVADLEMVYQFGQSRASSFGRAGYTVHGFWFTVRFPISGARR